MVNFKNSSYSIISNVIDDIENTAERRVMKAAVYLRKKVLESARATFPRVTGDLFSGIAAEGRKGVDVHHFNMNSGELKMGRAYAIVGFTRPAYHAHLLEFGTKERTVRNAFGKPGVEMKVGKVTAKPFFEPTLDREAGNVEEILSSPTWIEENV